MNRYRTSRRREKGIRGDRQPGMNSQSRPCSSDNSVLRFPRSRAGFLQPVARAGEHANLQYRIDGVLLPEGISVFGQELSTRFVDNLSLITGALPAEYGQRTAGVIDIQTKSGASLKGGEVSLYGGSYDTINPSFEYGGSSGKWVYYLRETSCTTTSESKTRPAAASRSMTIRTNTKGSPTSPTSSTKPAASA